MNKLDFEIIWIDEAQPDFIEITINAANQRLNAHFSCYVSLGELKKQWQKDLITQVLSGKKQTWDMQGSNTESVAVLIKQAGNTGAIALIYKIIFEKDNNNDSLEECRLRLIFDPAQLDSFCEQIQRFKGEIGETASIKK